MAGDTSERYDRVTVALHWTTAALVAVLWTIGQTADWLPRGSFRSGYWSMHVVGGFALALVLAWRLAWRAGPGRGLPAADRGLLHVIAKSTHVLLYALLVAVVVLGIINAFVRGYPIFGLFHLPQLGDPELRHVITQRHGLMANLLLALAGFHASAALVHQFILRDGLLRRMMGDPAKP